MPTENTFRGLTFSDSRDYAGTDFRQYLRPDTYEPRQSVFGQAAWEDWIDQGRLTPIMDPFSRSFQDIDGRKITGSRVSPLPSKEGSYTENTQMMVYYWVDGLQINTLYTLMPLPSVQLEMLVARERLNLRQKVLLFVSEGLGKALKSLVKQADESEKDDLNFLINFRKYASTYGIANALGVWVPTARVAEPISVVTGTSNTTGSNTDTGSNTTQKMNTDFLGLLVSGVGIFTGNPILIGGGLILSFIQNRNAALISPSTPPTISTTQPTQRFTGNIS